MKPGKIPRWPILLVLIAAVVAALVFNDDESSTRASATVAGATDAGASVPAAAALSTSWYSAEGTSTPDGHADETIVVASVADTRVGATVTVFPGVGVAPVSRALRLAPREQQRLRVADIVQSPEPAVVVEVVGGQAVVAHEITANGGVATEPCARGASSDWYFANGTTLKGSQQYLVLFDPFGDDAVVDISFLTDDGVQEPDTLQGLRVLRHSRISIPVHDVVQRQHTVGIHVRTRAGRVVAERSEFFDGTASTGEITRRGVTLSLGADSVSREWYFANGSTVDGGLSTLGVANFGASATNVDVSVVLDGDQTLAPQSVPVPARGVVSVDLAPTLPAGQRYAVKVTAQESEGTVGPVVAELLEWWPDSSASTGVATTMGSTRNTRRWVVPVPDPSLNPVITVLNSSGGDVTAELLVYTAGDTNGPPSVPGHSLGPGRSGVFDATELGAGTGNVLVVTSDRPVAVAATYTGADLAAASAAIPDYAAAAR